MDLATYEPTLTEVAALLGKSSRWISELRAKGLMPADGATLSEFVEAWGGYLAGKAEGPAGASLEAERTRLAGAQADAQEMKNAQLRLDLLPRTEVTAAVQAAFSRVRAKLLGLPTRTAPLIAAATTTLAVEAKLTEVVHEALAELSTTEVVADDGANQPGGGNGPGVVASDGSTTKADGEPVGGSLPVPEPRGQRRAGKVGHKKG